MGLTRGQTFGSTEQVTYQKLHDIIDLTTVSIDHDELTANMLTSLATASGRIPSFMLLPSLASGASIKYDGVRGFYGV